MSGPSDAFLHDVAERIPEVGMASRRGILILLTGSRSCGSRGKERVDETRPDDSLGCVRIQDRYSFAASRTCRILSGSSIGPANG